MSTPNNGINGTLGTGLIGHWGFDNGSLLDESGNNNTLNNEYPTIYQPAVDKDGHENSAITCISASAGSLKVISTNNVGLSLIPASISFWVNINFSNPLGSILSYAYLFGIDKKEIGNGKIILRVGTKDVSREFEFFTEGWHHIYVTKQKIFLDGVKYTHTADLTPSNTSYFKLWLFNGYSASKFTNSLDEIRCYNRILTDDEVAELYEMGVNYSIPKCETPVATPSGGNYTEAQTVILTCATPNSTIYYTLNGTNPTIFDDFYTEPISIIESTTIKAIAFANGIDASEIMTESYIINYPLETITLEGFYQTKLRNEITGEYVYILGKTNVTSTTFAHVKKYNIYGQLKQSQVAINNKTTLDVGYILEEDKNKVEKWWETKSTIWIEQENKLPILCTFVDTDFALKEEYDSESDNIYYTGTLNFE